MTKKLYVVSIQTEVLILASSPVEAQHLAEHEREIEWDAADYHASEMTHLPGGWDESCIPFGYQDKESPDRTVGEWIAKGAAPTYEKLRDAAKSREAKPRTQTDFKR